MLHRPGGATLTSSQSTAFGGAMNGPTANAAIDGGCTTVSGKLLITEMVNIDGRPVVYHRPASGAPT
jgi:hypothetical protein